MTAGRRPRVSVMMPAFNAERFLTDAIASAVAQRFTSWELLVVDDGSVDRTAAIVRALTDPRVRLIQQPSNRGEAAARNLALRHSRGEFVAFLDADDLWLDDHLSTTVTYLDTHPGDAAVYTDGFYINEDGRRIRTLSTRRRQPAVGRIFDEVVRGSDMVSPPVCVVLRADLIRRRGLQFDEDIVIGPDWDFFLRFSESGRFGRLDAVTCLYRVHRSNITVRTGLQRRSLELAKCRTKAAHLDSFARCPPDVKFNVFYDLLVNLLRDFPDRQDEVTRWPSFAALPADDRARLLRLTASKAIVIGGDDPLIAGWLSRARQLSPGDWRGAIVQTAFSISPAVCRAGLRLRTRGQVDTIGLPTFADLQGEL